MYRFARAASGVAITLTLGAVAMADIGPTPPTLRRGDPASITIVKTQVGTVTSASHLRRDAGDPDVVKHQDVSITLNHAKDTNSGRTSIKSETDNIPANVLTHYAPNIAQAHHGSSK